MKKRCLLFAIQGVCSLPIIAQVGIGTTTPNSMLDVHGSMSTSFRTFSTSTIITGTDHTVVFTGTAATTATLPTAVGVTGRVYWIKNASATLPTPTLTVATTSSQTIDGATTWLLDEANEVMKVISNGTNWLVLSQNVAIPGSGTTGGPWLQGGNSVSAVKTLGTTTSFDLPFITNNTEKMRLNTSGYLGLNTTSPAGRLHMVNETLEAGNDYIFDDYGAGTTQGIYLTKSRGTAASPTNLQNGDQIGALRFIPRYNGSLTLNAGTGLEVYYKGDGTTNLEDMRFFTGGTEKMRISETGNVAVGVQSWDLTNPEKLLVDAGSTGSFNVISGRGTINYYLQLNIQNRSNGANASSDVVASANNATESVNFIDMGINSSGYNSTLLPILNGNNTAYLYGTGRDFVIGNAASTYNLLFFTDGFDVTDEKLRITSAGNVGIGTTSPADKLSVAGAIVPAADNTYTLGKSGARW
ncbi:MAG: hypothetical protein ACJ751_11810, partial [Niastella sp.]|uniref:hypothetical protein n=1 Tax=Niastella sp. TaxID=1869183 RepID=UPI003899971F